MQAVQSYLWQLKILQEEWQGRDGMGLCEAHSSFVLLTHIFEASLASC